MVPGAGAGCQVKLTGLCARGSLPISSHAPLSVEISAEISVAYFLETPPPSRIKRRLRKSNLLFPEALGK